MDAISCLEDAKLDEQAVNALSAFNTETKRNNVDMAQSERYFGLLAHAFQGHCDSSQLKIQINQLAFRAINNLVRKVIVQDADLACCEPVIPVLFDYICPDSFAVDGQAPNLQSNGVRAVHTLQDIYLKEQPLINKFLKEYGFTHANARVRCASLMLLQAHISLIKCPFRPFTPSVTYLLNDPDPQVSAAATDLLMAVFGPASTNVKQDLHRELKRQRIRQDISVNILRTIGFDTSMAAQVRQAANKAATANQAEQTPSPVGNTSGGVFTDQSLIDKIEAMPAYKMHAIAPEDVASVASFRQIVESLAPCFQGKELDTNWEARERAVNRLRALIRGNMFQYPGDIVWALKRLAFEIRQAIESLRTTLCSAALQLVKDCSQLLKSYMDPLIDPYMAFLVEIVSSTKKITANLAFISICSLLVNTSLSMKPLNHIHAMASHQLPFSRECAFKWMHIVLVVHSAQIKPILESTGGLDLVISDIKRGIIDAKSEVREAARASFWMFAMIWTAKAEQIGGALDASTKKALMRSQPKEMLESYHHNFALHVEKKPDCMYVKSAGNPSTAPIRASSVKSQSGPIRIATNASRDKRTVTAQANVTDIVRRLSRSLNEPKQRHDHVLEATLPSIAQPELKLPDRLIDAMAEEAVDLSADQMQQELVKKESEPLEKGFDGANETHEAIGANIPEPDAEKDAAPRAEPAAPADTQTPEPLEPVGARGEPQLPAEKVLENPEVQGMLVETLMQSAQEAVADIFKQAGKDNDLEFDPAVFADSDELRTSDQFKEALRSQLTHLPTVDISLEEVASQTAMKMAPKFKEYIEKYPESRETIEQAAKLVEAAARNKGDKAKQEDGDSKDRQANDALSENDGVVDAAVKEVEAKNRPDQVTSGKVSSLADLLDSDDVDTMAMGVNALSFLIKGQRPPAGAFPGLGTLSIPPPDIIGKALNYLFNQAMSQNPQVKEVIERYTSSDLVAITLSYVGHALVMYVAVHMLPAEALVLTIQVIQPMLKVGTIIDTLFEIANADDVSEAALLALGGVLTGFDKVPMNPAIREKAKAALEVIYRLGDLSSDVTAFLADWIGFESDSENDTDSDDDSDDEKIAGRHAEKFERNMAARTHSSVAEAIKVLALEENTAEAQAVYAQPISSLHPISVSWKPVAGTSKAVRHTKATNYSSLDHPLEYTPDQPDLPESEVACFNLFDQWCSQLHNHTIDKYGLMQLNLLASGQAGPQTRFWVDLPAFQERVNRAVLGYCIRKKYKEEELTLALRLLRTLLEEKKYSSHMDQLRVLECLTTIAGLEELPSAIEYVSLPRARDALLLNKIDGVQLIESFVSVLTTAQSVSARAFALGSIRRIVVLTKEYSPNLVEVVRISLDDPSVHVRKEAYKTLLDLKMQSEAAAVTIQQQLTQGQIRLFEYYSDGVA